MWRATSERNSVVNRGMEDQYVPMAQYPINPTQSRKAAV